MKAIHYYNYGSPDVLRLEDVEKPAPWEGEVLIKVHAAALNAADWHLIRAEPFLARAYAGWLKPRNPAAGSDLAGRVEAVGKNVTRFRPGDEVYSDVFACGLGAFAEYKCAAENALCLKPVNLSFEEAAAVPMAAVTALKALRDFGKIKAGQKVLINGASGGVGTFAVQIAKAFGAEVTGVCSPAKMELVRSLGADHVIDYTREDFTQNGKRYDLILAANGYHPIWDYKRALSPAGVFVMSGGTTAQMFQTLLLGPLFSMGGDKKMTYVSSHPDAQDLAILKELIEAGKVVPVIDRVYPLSEIATALRYLEEGHTRGKVVITMEAGDK